MEKNIQHQKDFQNQTVIMINKQKSVGLAFIFALFFGPLGLLYASITGGIIMFLVNLVLLFILPGVGLVISWIICIIWAVIAAQNTNQSVPQNIVTVNH